MAFKGIPVCSQKLLSVGFDIFKAYNTEQNELFCFDIVLRDSVFFSFFLFSFSSSLDDDEDELELDDDRLLSGSCLATGVTKATVFTTVLRVCEAIPKIRRTSAICKNKDSLK